MEPKSVYAGRGFRVGVFLDSSNIHASVKNAFKGREPDHAQILKVALADNRLARAIAYCVRMGKGFEHWKEALRRYGFEFRTKELQKYRDGASKGDVDMELAMDVWRNISVVDMIVLVSGDGDFVELVKRCQECGKIVRVISVPGTTHHLLEAAADEYVSLGLEMTREAP